MSANGQPTPSMTTKLSARLAKVPGEIGKLILLGAFVGCDGLLRICSRSYRDWCVESDKQEPPLAGLAIELGFGNDDESFDMVRKLFDELDQQSPTVEDETNVLEVLDTLVAAALITRSANFLEAQEVAAEVLLMEDYEHHRRVDGRRVIISEPALRVAMSSGRLNAVIRVVAQVMARQYLLLDSEATERFIDAAVEHAQGARR